MVIQRGMNRDSEMLLRENATWLVEKMEEFDSHRIGLLIDSLAEQADNLVVALQPEDAAAVDDGYHRVTEI